MIITSNGKSPHRYQKSDYDHLSRRAAKYVERWYASPGVWRSWETHTFVYDGWNPILETVVNHVTGTTNTVRYLWGLDLSETLQGAGGVGGLVAVVRDGATYFPCCDANGNVTEYVSESGAAVASYAYDAFGNLLSASGPMADAFSHRFSTKYRDAGTGLYYYGYRFYSPEMGRWINRDPIEEEGGENLYAFCQNNSISQFDNFGKNVYLVEGNDTGYEINDRYHQSICVDDANSLDNENKKTCFSFGLVGVGCYLPKRTWLGWYESTLGGLLMRGEVYETTFVGVILRTKTSSKAQDAHWLAWMRSARKGLTDVYSVARHNCRRYSQNEFHDASGTVIP